MKSNSRTVLSSQPLTRSWPLLGALIFLAAFHLQADAPPTTLHLTRSGADTEGLATYRLDWNAVNATYVVQSATDLTVPNPWQTIEVVTPTNSTGLLEIKGRSIPENSVEYFRLILPQPQIFSVEPAIFPPGAPVDAFVVGQCFETNDVVRVNGVALSGVIYVAGGLLECTLPPQSAGPHLVELVRGGVVRSSFTVTCADAFPNPELVLQGPPDEPLASPSATLESTTGETSPDGDRNVHVTNSVKSKFKGKALKPGISVTADSFDIVDGKKGLNAVNVKLARVVPRSQRAYLSSDLALAGGGGVSPSSGEAQECTVDMVIPGRGLDFIWARTYNSRIGRSTSPNGWTFSYNVSLTAESDGSVVLRPGNGRADAFYPNSNGGWTRPEYFLEIGDLDSDGFPDVVTFADTGKWVFNSLLGGSAPGMLSQIVDRNGNTMRLHYDGAGKLAQVVDDLDRTNTVAYNLAGQIESVTDFSGRTVRYEYDGNGDLVACVSPPVIGTPNGNDFPGGKTNRYTYTSGFPFGLNRQNHLLLSGVDALGQTTAQFSYDLSVASSPSYLRCVALQEWTNAPTTFSYLPQTPTPANQFATLRCVVNDPVGNVTECFFDARNRAVKLQEFTGRATPGVPVTATVNRPTGKLRASDPDYYESRAEWNNDSLLSKIKREYSGDKTFSYASDFDPATPARKRADCRVVREIASGGGVDLDGDGTLDLTERVSRYEYDPRFGSDPTTFKGPPRIFILLPSSGPGMARDWPDYDLPVWPPITFVTSATDPRGNVTTGSYDVNGNCTKVTNVIKFTATANFADMVYNPHGQLTAITNAPDGNGYRRVDTFEYYPNGPAAGYLQKTTTDRLGHELTHVVQQSSRGRITSITDPRGHDTLYTYNALDQLVRYQTPTNLTARTATDFTYDANDNLVWVETERRDENDLVIVPLPTKGVLYQYDALNRCTEIVQQVSANNFITNRFAYDANDNVVAVHSPLAVSGADPHAITQLVYDERDLPFQTIAAPGSPDQSTTQCDYDANGNVTRVSEGLEGAPSITTLNYDGFAGFGSASLQRARAAGAHVVVVFSLRFGGSVGHGFYALPEAGDDALASSSFEHGNIIQPVIVGSDWGSTSSLQVSGGARYVSAGATCEWSDGTAMRASKITDPLGNITTLNFDANDNLKIARHFGPLSDTPGTNGNVRLAESRWKYDGLDRLTEARTAFFNPATQTSIGDGASVTTLTYAPNGQCTNVTDDLGRATTLAYDTAGRHISTTSAGAKTVTAVLRDAAGNVTSATQTDTSDLGGLPQVFARTNVYDSLNRLVSTVDNVGNTNRYAYDSASRVVRATDPKGNVRWESYDDLGRQTFAIADLDSDGLQDGVVDVNTSWAYDANSRLVSVTDDNTNTTYYAYDSLGRQVLAISPDGTAHTLGWNVNDDLVREQNANGTVITNSYDLLGRCVRRDITPGAGVAATTTFETFAYDGASRLVAATNDLSHSEFEYDSLGNCVGNHSDGWNVLSAYDSVGNRVSLTYPSGRIVTYAYDALDQVTNVSSTASAMTAPTTVASFAYDGPGRAGRIIRANGVNTRINWNGLVAPPNAAGDFGRGQVSGINHQVSGGGAVIDRRITAYDRNQNKTLRAQTAPFYGGGPLRTNTFGYDALNRMTGNLDSILNLIRFYELDGNGNRRTVFINGIAQYYGMNAAIPPADFQMDNYTTTPFGSQSYDENGNLTARITAFPTQGVLYQYDYASRLIAVQSELDEAGTGVPVITPVASYSYNALGQRISKTVYPPAPALPVTKEHVYDFHVGEVCDDEIISGDMLEVRQSGVLIDSFIHNPDDGQIVASASGVGVLRYYHSDDLGNTLALTDEFGAVSGRTDYADFGLPFFLTNDGTPIATNASPIGNRLLFGGREWDAETGLYYGAGFSRSGGGGNPLYDPQTGRVINNGMPNRISMNVTVPKQTQGATFGEKVNKSLHAPGAALSQGASLLGKQAGPSRAGGRNNPWSGDSPSAMQKGTVKFFNEAKGFGPGK